MSSDQPVARTRPDWLIVLVLAGLSMLGPFTIDTIFPGFTSMGEQFGVDSTAMQQVTTAYLVPFAVMSIVHGPLSDAVGRKPVMIAGLLGYVVASVLCALAPSLGWLLAGRALQGFFAGAATVVSRAVVRDIYEGHRAQKVMGQVMMIFSIAPAIAPVIGGWVLLLGPWPGVFWFVAAYGALVAVLTILILPETLDPQDREPLRPGVVLSGLWEVARSWRFERLSLATGFTFAAYIFHVMAAPIIVVDLLGLGEQDFWMLFVPLIGGMAFGSWLTGRLAGRIPTRVLVDRTLVFIAGATTLNILLAAFVPTLPWVLVGPTMLGAAIGLIFPVLQLALLDLFPHHRGAAASVAAFVILAFNAVLAGIVAPLVTASMLTTAMTSAVLSLLGMAFWLWHRSATTS